jgi:hypothetical protein
MTKIKARIENEVQDEERRALSSHVEEGYRQALRGELTDGDEARREIQAMKDNWLEERARKR